MYCNNCGAQLAENSRFCQNCGQLVQSEKQNVSAASTYEGPMGNPTPVLVWGIISLAFACSFFLSFLGIVFGIVGLNKYNTYVDFCGTGSKQAHIGRKLSKAGLIVGIILTVLFILYFIAFIFAVSNGSDARGFLAEILRDIADEL